MVAVLLLFSGHIMDFIDIIDDTLPDELCQSLIRRFETDPHVAPGRTGAGIDSAKKRSRDITLDGRPEWQDAHKALIQYSYPHIRNYLDKHPMLLMGAVSPQVLDPSSQQPVTLTPDNYATAGKANLDALVQHFYRSGYINLQHYQQGRGGYPHWHSEIYPQAPHNEPLHRVLLWMFYLNDVEEGGETEFYYQKARIAPRRGRMVIAPAGFTHTHRGNVPLSGDKYIATSWVMFQRAEQLYGKG